MSNGTGVFDIRNMMNGSDLERAAAQDPDLQAGYDAVNRLAAVLADISFAELFTHTWDDLVPRIHKNIDAHAAHDTHLPVHELKGHFTRLAAAAPGKGFQHALQTDWLPGAAAGPIAGIFADLAGHHVHLIHHHRLHTDVNQRMKTVSDLIQHAGNFNYRSIYETYPAPGHLVEAKRAVQDGNKGGIVPLAINNLCCNCVPGSPCSCAGQPNSYCSCPAGVCSFTSVPCP
jgi:hypothetical protein